MAGAHLLLLALSCACATSVHSPRRKDVINLTKPDVKEVSVGAVVSSPRHRRSGVELMTPNSPLGDSWIKMEKALPPRVILRRHSALVLECHAMGTPTPAIYWLKDGSPISQDDLEMAEGSPDLGLGVAKSKGRLVIQCASKRHEGKYSCVAETPFRRQVTSTRLWVKGPSVSQENPWCNTLLDSYGPPSIHMWSSTLISPIGLEVILPCRASGLPQPQVTWTDSQGQRVGGGPGAMDEEDSRFRVLPSGDLLVQGLLWEDMDEYTCHATNQLGTDSHTTFLYPLLADDEDESLRR